MQNPQCNGLVHTHIHSFAGKYFRPIFDLGFSVCILLRCSLGMNILKVNHKCFNHVRRE